MEHGGHEAGGQSLKIFLSHPTRVGLKQAAEISF